VVSTDVPATVYTPEHLLHWKCVVSRGWRRRGVYAYADPDIPPFVKKSGKTDCIGINIPYLKLGTWMNGEEWERRRERRVHRWQDEEEGVT